MPDKQETLDAQQFRDLMGTAEDRLPKVPEAPSAFRSVPPPTDIPPPAGGGPETPPSAFPSQEGPQGNVAGGQDRIIELLEEMLAEIKMMPETIVSDLLER